MSLIEHRQARVIQGATAPRSLMTDTGDPAKPDGTGPKRLTRKATSANMLDVQRLVVCWNATVPVAVSRTILRRIDRGGAIVHPVARGIRPGDKGEQHA